MAESTETISNEASPDANAVPLPKGDPSAFLADYKEYLAYQVAESARQQLVSWAKWIIGVIVLFITILGLKTYFDVQSKITSAIAQQLLTAQTKTNNALDKFNIETNAALAKLKTETDLVKAQADQAGALISEQTTQVRSKYALFMGALPGIPTPQAIAGLTRLIYDARHKEITPGTLVRSEGMGPSSDRAVNDVYDNIAVFYKFINDKFGSQLLTNNSKIIATVHYGNSFDNRFWDGKQLVFGDGDGKVFVGFSGLESVAGALALSVIGEKTKLRYEGEAGALIVNLSDVIAVMAEQYHRQQRAEDADWLVDADVFASNIKGALRSMKAPGTAYDNEIMGKDPQPSHMKNYVKTDADNGGVHLNSGIPNHAFYLASVGIGGFSWEKTGVIWIKSLEHITKPDTSFTEFAAISIQTAQSLYGNDSNEAKAVEKAWVDVGIKVK